MDIGKTEQLSDLFLMPHNQGIQNNIEQQHIDNSPKDRSFKSELDKVEKNNEKKTVSKPDKENNSVDDKKNNQKKLDKNSENQKGDVDREDKKHQTKRKK